jgi:amino acid transporter
MSMRDQAQSIGTAQIRNSVTPKATAIQLIFMIYSVICSGAYGLESMVSASGPGLAMLILLVLPVIYAAPMALTCSELTARYPVEGGYYRWVRMAFGDFVGYNVGWLVWLTMFATNASFAVLFTNYLRYFAPDLSGAAHFVISAALVWIVVLLNYRGIGLVGAASVILTVIIIIPFAIMTVMGLLSWGSNPMAPFVNSDRSLAAAVFGGIPTAIWLYGGFERMTVSAEEVENPVRAFPLALGIGVPLCALSYIAPTFAGLAANGDWRDWGESYFTTSAAKIGGAWLGAFMAAGALVSNMSILLTTMLSQSRLPMVLAEDGLFPRIFERRHPRFGSPVASLVVTGMALTGFCVLRLDELIGIYAIVQSIAYLLIYATLIKLRYKSDKTDGTGFRIPVGVGGLVLMVLPSAMIGVFVVYRGVFTEGNSDAGRILLHLLIFASGPITFFLARLRRRKLKSEPGETTPSRLNMAESENPQPASKN